MKIITLNEAFSDENAEATADAIRALNLEGIFDLNFLNNARFHMTDLDSLYNLFAQFPKGGFYVGTRPN